MHYDVTAIGESLVDFSQCGISENGSTLFECNPGGAPANLAVTVANLGGKSAFIGAVGNDVHGAYLKKALEEKNVDTLGLTMIDDAYTTLSFQTVNDKGERELSFVRKPGADMILQPEHVNRVIVKSSRIIHFGSLSLTNYPIKSAIQYAIRMAKKEDILVSFDPNYMDDVWSNKLNARICIDEILKSVDLLKVSEEEAYFLSGVANPLLAADYFINAGIKFVCITLGAKGSIVKTRNFHIVHEPINCEVAAKSAAGDTFWGCMLYKLSQEKNIDELVADKVKEYMKFSCSAATLSVKKNGGIHSIPTLDEITDFINKA